MRFSSRQKSALAAMILAYSAAYLNRMNLSAALSCIIGAYGISTAEGGLCQSLFAFTYACGQLINGMIADRVNPKKLLTLGLCGSALINFLMGICPSYPMFLCLCVLNGAFQSMLWTPILRLVAIEFPVKIQQHKANFLLSFTMVAGHLGAWAIAGAMIESFGWKLSFILPAVITVPVILIVFFLLRSVTVVQTEKKTGKQSSTPLPVRLFLKTGFIPVLLGSILYGFAKDGIITWAPSILQSLAGDTQLSPALFSLIIPVLNAIGLVLGYVLIRKVVSSARIVCAIMSAAACVFCLLLPISQKMLWVSLWMGAACASLYGMNTSLTSLVPLEYRPFGHVAIAGGLIDSLIYFGSSLSGIISGTIIDHSGYSALYLLWMLISLGVSALLLFSAAKRFRLPASESQEGLQQ